MKKIWKLKNLYPENGDVKLQDLDTFIKEIRSLKAKIQLPDMIIRLLYMRGISDYSKVIKFFKPTLEKLYDPYLMKDCEIATERIVQAITNKEKLLVIGDYDVDGTCGASMFYLFLKHFGLDSLVYIPDRITEGYGISNAAIDKAVEEDIKLIVAIDCGITAIDKAVYAKSRGRELIICDHHRPPDAIPDALAVLDPLREDCTYPFKYLCGTGVAFKLIQAVCRKYGEEKFAATLLDFVALATSSDIVPLIDENRILVTEGFKLINTNSRPSIKTLIEAIGLKAHQVNTSNIVYSVAPRINAVGRLGDAKRAVELLTSDEPTAGLKDLVNILDVENDNRRELDKGITDDVYKIVDDAVQPGDKFSIILHNEEWHPGVIGIVAARLVEKYHLPSIVLTTVNGVAKGSARSINGFNIYDALKQCEEYLIQFGGHYHAAGLEIKLSNIENFRKAFNEIASKEFMQAQPIPEIEVDAEINFEDITPKFTRMLSFFEPFGPGNSTPVFISRKVSIVGEVRSAKSNTHLFRLRDRRANKTMDAVFFSSPEYHDDLMSGRECDVCYCIDKSMWNGVESTKLRIRDITFND